MTAPVLLVLGSGLLIAMICRPRPATRQVHGGPDRAGDERSRGQRFGGGVDRIRHGRLPRQPRRVPSRIHRAVERVGQPIVGILPPSIEISPVSTGWAFIGSVLLLPVHFLGSVVLFAAAIGGCWARGRRRRAAAHRATVAECASFATLLSVAVGCGLTPRLALEELAMLARGPLAGPNRHLADALRAGLPIESSLRSWATAVGNPADLLAHLLINAHRDGVAAAVAMGEMASSLRLQQRRHAEERARRLPVTLLMPLVACILPAFVMLTIIPMVVSGLNGLTFPS